MTKKSDSRIEWNNVTDSSAIENDKENTMTNNSNILNDAEKALIETVESVVVDENEVIEPKKEKPMASEIVTEGAKFVIDNGRISILPPSCTRVETLRQAEFVRSALSAFVDVYRKDTYRVVTPSLVLFASVDNPVDFSVAKQLGYVANTYQNNGAIELPDGNVLDLDFGKAPKEGWAEVWNHFGNISIDHRYLHCHDSEDSKDRNIFNKFSFIRSLASGCGYVFSVGPKLLPYVMEMFSIWEMSTVDARKESRRRYDARIERQRQYKMQVGLAEELSKSETPVEQTDLRVRSYPDGEEMIISANPGDKFQLFDAMGNKKYPVYWTEDIVKNVSMVKTIPAGWLWQYIARDLSTTPAAE